MTPKIKTGAFFILLLICSFQSIAQNAYYDAIYLKANGSPDIENGKVVIEVGTDAKEEFIKILKRYTSKTNLSPNELQAEFNSNPFINISGLAQGGLSNEFIQMYNNAIPAKGVISSIGGLDVTNVANALADLMIERAKEELTVAFFDRFKKFATANPEFGVLFPKTTSNLENLLSYKYPEMLPTLRTGFLDDLKQITFKLDDLLELPRYKELFKDLPEAKIAIRSLRLVQELETGSSNAADIIEELASYPEWSTSNLTQAGGVIKTAALISQSLRYHGKDSGNQIWVSAKELKVTFFDLSNPQTQITTKIFMGLLYQQALNQSIQLGSGRLSDEIARYAAPGNIDTFYDKLKEFIVLSEKVNINYRDLKHKLDSNITISDDDYHTYIGTSLDVVEYGFSLAKLFTADITQAENYLSILKESNDLYKNIYTKEYNQAITNLLDILAKINALAKNSSTNANIKLVNAKSCKKLKIADNPVVIDGYSIKKIPTGFSVSFSGQTLAINSLDESLIFGGQKVYVSSDEKNAFKKLFAFIDEVKPYALFIANVVESKSENDIKNALETVILPVGSSSIKKNTLCNVSIQSYLGAYWRTSAQPNATIGTWSDQFGVTAPIGISWTPGFSSWGNYGAISLFVPLFDIGAIVDYKLKKDSVVNSGTGANQGVISKEYTINLGQIISPGIFFVYGFGANLPLSLGFGAQYGPGLSQIDSNNNVVVNNPSLRYNFFLAVDLPFFNVINKSKFKK